MKKFSLKMRYILVIAVISFLYTNATFDLNSGLPPEVPAPVGINFDPKVYMHDFDLDGAPDLVTCRGGSTYLISITKRNGEEIFKSEMPTDTNNASMSLSMKCEVVYLQPNVPSIVVGSFKFIPGSFYGSGVQLAIVNKSTPTAKSFSRVLLNSGKASIVRGLKCTNLPYRKDGALCFFAAYHGSLFQSALIWIDKNGGFAPIGSNYNFLWDGGFNGSSSSKFPNANSGACNGSNYKVGKTMMDAAWVKTSDDDLPQLIVVGQHAPVMQFKIERTTATPLGFRFKNGSSGQFTRLTSDGEYLGISGYSMSQESNSELPCLYLTQEQKGLDGSYQTCGTNGNYDSLLCHSPSTKAWKQTLLPEQRLQGTSPADFQADASGTIYMRLREVTRQYVDGNSGNPTGQTKTYPLKYYRFNQAGHVIGEIESYKFNSTTGRHEIRGWACDKNRPSQVEVHIYLGGAAGSTTGKGVKGVIANLASTSVARARYLGRKCLTPQSTAREFFAEFSEEHLNSKGVGIDDASRKIYAHAISLVSGEGNRLIDASGSFTAKRP